MGIGEPDLFETVGVIGSRAAFKVDGVIGQQWNAGGRRHRVQFDRQPVELQLLLHGIDDFVADVDRKSDRLLIVVEV